MKIVAWKKFEDLSNDPKYSCVYDTERIKLIEAEMKDKGYRFSGYYHQYGEHGIPVFDDNTYTMVSMRSWGNIIAKLNNDTESMAYCNYAWNMENEITP